VTWDCTRDGDGGRIFFFFLIQQFRKLMLYNFVIDCNRLKHRGPDWSGLFQHGDFYLAHQRLAIIDPASGDQPLFNEDQAIVVTVGFYSNPL